MTHGWLSLRELMVHDWQRLEIVERLVDAEGYQEFKKMGRPQGWWDPLTSNSYWQVLTTEEMESRIAAGTVTDRCCTIIRREETHASFAEEFLTDGIPALFRVAAGMEHSEAMALARTVLEGDKTALAPLSDWLLDHDCPTLDDVRLVFWFHS